MHDDVNIYVSE